MTTIITHWIDTGLAEALGWTLLHSIWQGAAVALLLATGLILARSQPSRARYRIALSAMLVLLLGFIGTFIWMYEPVGAPFAASEDITLSFSTTQEALPSITTSTSKEAATNHPTAYLPYFEQHLPLLVSGWLLGVLLLGLRMLGEIAYIQHLRHYRCRQPERIWLEKLSQLKTQMGIRRHVGLRETRRIHSPMVVGVLKQVILLPAGLLANLPPEQVEAVLAHELAHVRRNDYLINLFISLAEILLFFNPMMWWISKKIKAERENACDDLALEMTGDTLALARSLATMEEWRLNGPSMAMAFAGKDGSVLRRIQRLLQRDDKRQVAAKAFWAVSILCVCLALLAFQSQASQPLLTDAVKPERIVEEPAPNTAPEPEAKAASPLPAPAKPALTAEPQPVAEPVPSIHRTDTIPADAREIEKEIRQLHEKMRAAELEMRKKEQALRSKELKARKEARENMQATRKALMELEITMRTKEQEREMLESEFEIAEQELELAEMQLEEQQHALEIQEEKLEEASGPELEQKLKTYQQAQKELLEKQKALQLRQFEAQKKQRSQAFEKEKAMQELQKQRFQMERELEMKEQEMEFKMMELQHEMEQLEAERHLLEQEVHARYRELERKMMEMED